MNGLRCPTCGETRWHLLIPVALDRDPKCPVCGGEVLPERRHPGRGPRGAAAAGEERRRADQLTAP